MVVSYVVILMMSSFRNRFVVHMQRRVVLTVISYSAVLNAFKGPYRSDTDALKMAVDQE